MSDDLQTATFASSTDARNFRTGMPVDPDCPSGTFRAHTELE